MVPEAKRAAGLVGMRTSAAIASRWFGGGDPASGSYPAEMLIDWVRVF
jgi:hypothetical protein